MKKAAELRSAVFYEHLGKQYLEGSIYREEISWIPVAARFFEPIIGLNDQT